MSTRTCRHDTSLWGRCTDCGLTWEQQAVIRAQRAAIGEWLAAEQEAQRIARAGRILGQLAFNYPNGGYDSLARTAIDSYRASDKPWRGDLLDDTYYRQRYDMYPHAELVRLGWDFGASGMVLHPSDPMCLAFAHWV